jgi:hypothetical protein
MVTFIQTHIPGFVETRFALSRSAVRGCRHDDMALAGRSAR